MQKYAGWWYSYPSEKYESQMGWLFPIYGTIKNVPNHQPGWIVESSVEYHEPVTLHHPDGTTTTKQSHFDPHPQRPGGTTSIACG